jgi:hypothetical protein
MTSLFIAVALFGVAFLAAGAFGFCVWCKKWTEGEVGYVADVEHGDDGLPLTGWRLETSRIVEGYIGTPLCTRINRALGRVK